jgi:hypothetical protein
MKTRGKLMNFVAVGHIDCDYSVGVCMYNCAERLEMREFRNVYTAQPQRYHLNENTQ